MTKQELQRYFWVRRNIEQLEEKLAELEAEAMRMTTRITALPKGGGCVDKLGNITAKVVDLQREINKKIEQSCNLLMETERVIEALPPRERYLIRARYLECKAWEQIAVDMHYSWRQVHYIHSRALQLLAQDCTPLHTQTC